MGYIIIILVILAFIFYVSSKEKEAELVQQKAKVSNYVTLTERVRTLNPNFRLFSMQENKFIIIHHKTKDNFKLITIYTDPNKISVDFFIKSNNINSDRENHIFSTNENQYILAGTITKKFSEFEERLLKANPELWEYKQREYK